MLMRIDQVYLQSWIFVTVDRCCIHWFAIVAVFWVFVMVLGVAYGGLFLCFF